MAAAPLDERVELLERRVTALEAKVERLETWAGTGQNMSFSDSIAELRKKFDEFGKVEVKSELTTLKTDMTEVKFDVATLNTDMIQVKSDASVIKGDMVEVKGTLGEILDRLPPRRETPGA